MTDTAYQQLETNQSGIKVVLEFPKQPKNEKAINREVKAILANALQEYLRTSYQSEGTSAYMNEGGLADEAGENAASC